MAHTNRVVPISRTLKGHYSHMLKESNIRDTLREGNEILSYKSKSRKRKMPTVKKMKRYRMSNTELYPSTRMKELSSIFGLVKKSGVSKETVKKKRKGDFNDIEEDDMYTNTTKVRRKKQIMNDYTFRDQHSGEIKPLSARSGLSRKSTMDIEEKSKKSERSKMPKSSSYLSLSTFDSSNNLLTAGISPHTWDEAGFALDSPVLVVPTMDNNNQYIYEEKMYEDIELPYGDPPQSYTHISRSKSKKKRKGKRKKKKKKAFWEVLDEEEAASSKPGRGKMEYFKPPPHIPKERITKTDRIFSNDTFVDRFRSKSHTGFHRKPQPLTVPAHHSRFMDKTVSSKNQAKKNPVDKLQQIINSPNHQKLFVDDDTSEMSVPELESEQDSNHHKWNISTHLPKIQKSQQKNTPTLTHSLSNENEPYFAELNFVAPSTKLVLKSSLSRQNSLMLDPLSPVFDPSMGTTMDPFEEKEGEKSMEEKTPINISNATPRKPSRPVLQRTTPIISEELKKDKPPMSRINSKLSLKCGRQTSVLDLMSYFKQPTKKVEKEEEDILPHPIQSFIMNSSLVPSIKDRNLTKSASMNLGRLTRSPHFNNSYDSLADLLRSGSNTYLKGTIASDKKRRTYHPGSPSSPNAHRVIHAYTQEPLPPVQSKKPNMVIQSKRKNINDYSNMTFRPLYSPNEHPVAPPTDDHLLYLDERDYS